MNEINLLPFAALDIRREEIATYLGMGEAETLPPFLLETVEKQLEEIAELQDFCFGAVPVSGSIDSPSVIRLSGILFAPGRIITHCLKGSESFILLLATIGEAMDGWLHEKRREGDIVESFVADALGSVVVEAIASYALTHLEQAAALSGNKITNSYSPGYCGWDVSEQQQLFTLLPPSFCGVRLTDSSLMLPVKSVSAVIGVGRNLTRKPYGCAICQKTDCFKRKNKLSL